MLDFGLAAGARIGAFLGQVVEDPDILQPLPQTKHSPQIALLVGELAVDLLGVLDVIPQIGTGGLLLQLSHLSPQLVDVQHSLDPREGGV
jgi:hypothetical protein